MSQYLMDTPTRTSLYAWATKEYGNEDGAEIAAEIANFLSRQSAYDASWWLSFGWEKIEERLMYGPDWREL